MRVGAIPKESTDSLIHRQFSVFTTSVGLAALAPIRYTMVASDLSFENHALSLGLGVVFDDKSLQLWYNYY